MGLGHARTYLKGYLMAIEKTFIMIKPDAVRDRKIGEIVARIERSGLVIERMERSTTPIWPTSPSLAVSVTL